MILFLSILFTFSLVIGVKIVTYEDMVLHPLLLKAQSKEKKIFEPLIICEWCMPSIYSLLGYTFAFLYVGSFEVKYLIFYPITVALSSLLSGVVWVVVLILLHNYKEKQYEDFEDDLFDSNFNPN